MTTGREVARGEKAVKVAYQESSRCSSRGSMRIKPGETIPPALRSSGSKKPTSPRLEREIGVKEREACNGSPSVDELLKTVKRLEKGFLSLADAVIAEIEGMREDARCWQEEREELWKTVMAFHSHQKSDMEPLQQRLDSLENRASDIEEHLQSRDPDTLLRAPANDRLVELERRAYELEKQVKKQQAHLLHGTTQQTVHEKPGFKEESLVYRPGELLEQHRSIVLEAAGSKRLGLSSRNSDSEEAILPMWKEIEEFYVGDRGIPSSENGEVHQTELQSNVSAVTHDLHKLRAWCQLVENDQAMRLQRLTESITEEIAQFGAKGIPNDYPLRDVEQSFISYESKAKKQRRPPLEISLMCDEEGII